MFEELTIAEFHQRFNDGTVSCSELVDWYLERIERLDQSEGGLRSVVTVNPKAREEAAARDESHSELSGSLPPLFGVPVLVKDQGLTAGIRTTFGSTVFKDYVPDTDASVVRQLREAGAVILGKTAMCDFAAGWFSSSSMTGHTSNAYDPSRDSGGSSAGSGTAVAANLCLVAVGEDTGGSIRIPASFNNCYGLRVTTGLVPRAGFSPLVHFQDTPGPMARTVDDLARLLDVLVSYDPADSFTSITAARTERTVYAVDSAEGPATAWRVGVLASAFGPDEDADSAQVNRVIRAAIDSIGVAGAEVKNGLEIDDLDRWVADTSVYTKVSPSDITRFLSNLPNAPARSFAEIYESKRFHPENDLFDDIADAPDDPSADTEYLQRRLNQEAFRRVVLQVFAAAELDFLIFPTVRVLPPSHQDLADGRFTCLTFPTNTVVASQAALPAVSVPAGFSKDGLPVGLEIVGRPLGEVSLLSFARHVEGVLKARVAPNASGGGGDKR